MKKALGVLLTFAVGVAGLLIAKEFNYAAPTPSPTTVADQVGEGFKYIVAQIRPSLPKSIDDATTLVDVSSAGMILTYRYKVDIGKFELDMKTAMKAGAVYEYSYRDGNSKSLGGFVVTTADCV